jgi:hypothetical protein
MLNALPGPILLDMAILLTGFCWGMGFYVADRRVRIFAPLAIGCFVCLTGYTAQSLGAPLWLVVAAPIPLDFLLLWYVLRRPRAMIVAYVSIWAIYLVVHVAFSALLRYDSLIPSWKLHS